MSTKTKAIKSFQKLLHENYLHQKLKLILKIDEKTIEWLEKLKIIDVKIYPMCWKIEDVDYSTDYGGESWIMEFYTSDLRKITHTLGRYSPQETRVGEYSINYSSSDSLNITENYKFPLDDEAININKALAALNVHIDFDYTIPEELDIYYKKEQNKIQSMYLKEINKYYGFKGREIQVGWSFFKVKFINNGWVFIHVRDVAKILMNSGIELPLNESYKYSAHKALKK